MRAAEAAASCAKNGRGESGGAGAQGAERKARGNNGARRNMHFEMETVFHDVYPPGLEGGTPFSTREVIRYRMNPPKFFKDVYCVHAMKSGDGLVSARRLSPQSRTQASTALSSPASPSSAICTRCRWSAS